MHPINKKYFGNTANTSIKVHFYNGNSTVTGWVVKQTGTSRYVVTADGVNKFTCQLAATTANATALSNGLCTVNVTNPSAGTEYAKKITEELVYTTAGNVYPWALVNPPAGQASLDHN
jgi:hypothetical protein